jgi:chromosome partitioning protein
VAKAGYTALGGCLSERPAYRKAQNTGHAVTETSYAGLNAKADALIQALIDRVEEHGRSDEAQTAELAWRTAVGG